MMNASVFAAATDTGLVRRNNEDEYLFSQSPDKDYLMLIIADGMGGHSCGEFASKIAVEQAGRYISEHFDPKMNDWDIRTLLDNACETANVNVELEAKTSIEMAGMGTTLTVGLIFNNNLYLAHVGDTRVYLLRQGKLMQLTRDHTYVQMLVERGEITREEAAVHPKRSMLIKALGVPEKLSADLDIYPLRTGDKLLFCTDGLYDVVSPAEIKEILTASPDVKRAVSQFIELTLQRGAPDNVTVIIGFLDGGFK